ncbi:hypothetical protein ATO6_01870 [Oceanicola sp. 22II-s10i]|nr:hypothetical protein ATO6_01870 [Oceanicola sp. 22II-s10i]
MKEYLTIRTASNQSASVGAALTATRLADGAARAIGLFSPQIGASVNTVFAIVSGEDRAALDRAAGEIGAIADVTSVDRQALTPAAERNLDMLGDSPAMFTNRWFHVLSDKAEAFEQDTIPVWDGFEHDTKCNVIGLWHTAPRDGVTSYLLVARYDDLLAWSNSRYYNMDPNAPKPAWVESFARRRGYMTDTSVIATRCIGTSAA